MSARCTRKTCWPSRDRLALALLTLPTLIVRGNGDHFFETKWAYWLRDTIPGAHAVIELPGARLFFPDERADELAAAITRHWAGSQREQLAG